MYVCNARGFRASRLNNDEAGRDDADRDGHSWLQRHGWGIRNSVTRDDGDGTRFGRGKESGLYIARLLSPWPGPGERVVYMYAMHKAVV